MDKQKETDGTLRIMYVPGTPDAVLLWSPEAGSDCCSTADRIRREYEDNRTGTLPVFGDGKGLRL